LEKKLVYITSNRIPSEKANSFQTISTVNSLADYFDKTFILFPRRKTHRINESIKDFYGVEKNFTLKEIFTLDTKIYLVNTYLWNLISKGSFYISLILYLIKNKSGIIYTRDVYVAIIISFLRKIGLIQSQKVIFESHEVKDHLINFLKFVDGIITINEFQKKVYERKLNIKVKTIHDGVKLKKIKPYKKRNNKIKILYTGNLSPEKGVYTLLEAYQELDEKYDLDIVGGSPNLLDSFKKIALQKKRIPNIHGHVKQPEILKFVEKAEILIIPNSSEHKINLFTSPMKLFEYMSYKRLIIASDIPAIKEVLVDKKDCIMFKSDNHTDLSKKIQNFNNYDYDSLIKNSYEKVKKFTWEERAKNIHDFISRSI